LSATSSTILKEEPIKNAVSKGLFNKSRLFFLLFKYDIIKAEKIIKFGEIRIIRVIRILFAFYLWPDEENTGERKKILWITLLYLK